MSDPAPKIEPETKRPKHGRSPAYPGISLSEAIEKARALYNAEGKYAAPMPSAFKAWGFSEKSSGGRETRAALRYFGLISIEGDSETGKVKLTDDAYRVIMDTREDQTEKNTIVRRLALTPAIHQKLAAQYPEGIKSDSTAVHFLMFDEGYSPTAAAQLIEEFKATATFSRLFEPDTILDKQETGSANDRPAPVKQGEPAVQTAAKGQVKLMQSERVAFTEESNANVYVKLVISGEVDDLLLDALDAYVKRQRKRLGLTQTAGPTAEAQAQSPVQSTAQANG
jgi:hypothetical protein